MLNLHCHQLLFSTLPIISPHSLSLTTQSPFLHFPRTPTHHLSQSLSAIPLAGPDSWLAQLADAAATLEGPVELPLSAPSIFSTTDDPSPIQVATSVLLTGAVTVFLFRSIRRRAKRVKEQKFRSSGAKKSLKEEALDSLKAIGSAPIDAKAPPSPVQALLGGISAGVIALILYKFTTTIEAALNRQTVSENFSVRQITITIRTIVNGLCYLATFVFGINSVGLFLYSGQLAINSFMGDSSNKESESEMGLPNSTSESSIDSTELTSSKDDQSSK